MVLSLSIFIYERSFKPNQSGHYGSSVTLNINIKLNPEELHRLINVVEEIDRQKHEFLVKKLQTIQSSHS